MVNKPHGGGLIDRTVSDGLRNRILEERDEMAHVGIRTGNAIDLENIGLGVLSPLSGFMNSDELHSVLDDMRFHDVPWTIPIVLDIQGDFSEGDLIMLYNDDTPMARMYVEDIYTYNWKGYAQSVFGTTDLAHPGVLAVKKMGSTLVGGSIELLSRRESPFADHYLTPLETRALFHKRGWETIVAFQTRNVAHIGHEFLQKTAVTFVDGLFVNPVIGRKKRGDFRDEVILHAYSRLLEAYYPPNIVHMSILNYEMKYAGPKEAIHHAIMRKNFGCTHIIIGRDHAGVGSYYDPYEAQDIFKEFPDLGMSPMSFQAFFYCHKCGNTVNAKICPHDTEFHDTLSGTRMREMILTGDVPEPYQMRKEVFEAIRDYEDPFVGE